MEGLSFSANSQHQYQSAQWSRLVRRNTLVDSPPLTGPSIASGTSQLPTQLNLFPILLPQQSLYHQEQLARYNQLISASRTTSRLQSAPLPPLLSAQHIQALPGSRSGFSGGKTARNTKASSRVGHGNKEPRKPSKGERALIAEKDPPATMAGKKVDASNQLPARPLAQHRSSAVSQQSNSVPSTPQQHARKFSFESREPSPNANINHSPRSAYSESHIALPSSRPIPPLLRGRCRYETAMEQMKRRIPYSIGSDTLEKVPEKDLKSKLSKDEERKMTTDMRELYDRLLPTPETDTKRKKLVQKLEKLFNDKWPGHDIRVHVFGSSGNLLCTDNSDVDICITTTWKELEGVCKIAELLANNGMEKVICVSTAKVPIVKIWDPELCLACDMNVNNTLALENTRMVKTYIQIDPRVRPLAMAIKHWTKRRILNDAAFGGTLSSYTWICMIINFLQSRNPPILPALHQRPHLKLPAEGGNESAFADDLDALKGFGDKNEETLGELLFQFFRFYGHEFDYENLVVSVRNGKQISKIEKKWHLANNNMLCVEEPFNVGRNLANTADDTSFRGLHLEIRRAYDLLCIGKLEECCSQYEYPKEEERIWERPAAKPKPVIRSASQSIRGGKGGNRGGGRQNQQRNPSNNRRASSGAFETHPPYTPAGMPPNFAVQDAWLQQQAQAQLHNDLFATYSVLQAQENSLRLQLFNQSQAYMQAQAQQHAFAQSHSRSQGNGSVKQQATDRNRTSSFDQPPLTAPIRPDMYFYPLQYPGQPIFGFQTPSTNPSSPSLSHAVPELRRSIHRSTITNGSGIGGMQSASSLRSHSQPATRSVSTQLPGAGITSAVHGIYRSARQTSGSSIPSFIPDENLDPQFESHGPSLSTTPPEESNPKEYVGYYVNRTGQNSTQKESLLPMAIPSFGDIQESRRRLSTDQFPQSIIDRLKRTSRSPSPLGRERSVSATAHSAPLTAVPSLQGVSSASLNALNHQSPMVVDGSFPIPVSIPRWQASVSEGAEFEYLNNEAAPRSGELASQDFLARSDFLGDSGLFGQSTPGDLQFGGRNKTPPAAQGSFPQPTEPIVVSSSMASSSITSPHVAAPNGLAPAETPNGSLRLSPGARNRSARPAQNGGMSPLDIGLGQAEALREAAPHLSPVYETRTPSPIVSRKFEPAMAGRPPLMSSLSSTGESSKAPAEDHARGNSLLNGNHVKQPPTFSKPNGHTRAAKSESSTPSGWQKIGKGKRKGPPPELKNTGYGQSQSEKVPTKDSDRKGG